MTEMLALVNKTGREYKNKTTGEIFFEAINIHEIKHQLLFENLLFLYSSNNTEPTYYYKNDFKEINKKGYLTRVSIYAIPICLN